LHRSSHGHVTQASSKSLGYIFFQIWTKDFNMNILTGIYKITNPVGAVYIGESKDIYKRWNRDYKYLICKGQRKLYNSFVKYGVENHTFEIIKECKIEEIPYYERHYQEYYNVLDREFGLNLKYTNVCEKKQVYSEESCKKMSESKKGKPSWNKGKTGIYSEETLKKMSESAKNMSENHKRKLSEKAKGKIFSDTHRKKIGDSKKGSKNVNSKKVINTETNEIYDTAKEMCEILGLKYCTMIDRLNGRRKNKTPFRYLDTIQ
jgi:group I intron endonuclease